MLALLVVALLAVYLVFPTRTNVLLLGIDRAPKGTEAARADTLILTTFTSIPPYVGMLSIPRDLWVTIAGQGQNRINTAHFFAEAEAPGSGPRAEVQAVRQNFGIDVYTYVRINFRGLSAFVDALGGLDLELPQAMSGYAAGRHHLDGKQALAFVRDRAGTDDFFRMGRGQLFLKAVLKEVANPLSWGRLPFAAGALLTSVDTNVPVYEWPRLMMQLMAVGPGGIDARTITRDMVTPFVTNAGAQVLAPNWERINPVLLQMFGQ